LLLFFKKEALAYFSVNIGPPAKIMWTGIAGLVIAITPIHSMQEGLMKQSIFWPHGMTAGRFNVGSTAV
jgi:hypothetical protein